MSWLEKEEEILSSGLSVEDLSSSLKIPPWVAKVLHKRMKYWGDQTLEGVHRFLNPSLKQLPDPFLLPDMDRAAERLCDAVVEKQTIAIYGDYDVDGTVGTAILRRFLRSMERDPLVFQPDRQKDGYGINAAAVKRLAEDGANLLIAVDCGITAVKEVELANQLGMDVIICDHHEPKELLPPAYAVLDHKRKDNESSIQSLSGAGVAFYLAIAVRSMLRDIGYFEEHSLKEPDIRDLLDLVALATVADMVPLVDENRILLKAGLEKMRRNPILGIRELLKVAEVKLEEVGTYHLGFLLGPRINASGRLGSANGALELLSTDSPEEAQKLAQQLDLVNKERMRVQGEVAEDALARAQDWIEKAGGEVPAIVVFADHWHEGVIGIVASRVVEKYQRPTVVITFSTHSGFGKGSVRGFGPLDMTAALESCSPLLEGFGGHKAAAGLSLKRENLEAFRSAFCDAVGSQVEALTDGKERLWKKEILVDARIENSDLNSEAVDFLESMGPFGMGNAEPAILVSGFKVAGMRTLKERHLKIQFSGADNSRLEGFWANGVGQIQAEEKGSVEIVCVPQINNFRNLHKLELKIKNIRVVSN